MKNRTSQVGNNHLLAGGSDGFTLFELLIVITILSLTAGALTLSYSANQSTASLKSTAHLTASRLRDIRASAIFNAKEELATIDVKRRIIAFSDGRKRLKIDNSIGVKIVAADNERISKAATAIRFYPNGSSSGGTIQLNRKQQTYEVQVHWLTGRIAAKAKN